MSNSAKLVTTANSRKTRFRAAVAARAITVALFAGLFAFATDPSAVAQQTQPPPKKAPPTVDDDAPIVYSKLEDKLKEIPTVKDLLDPKKKRQTWVVFKNQDVMIVEPVKPRPDTLKTITAKHKLLLSTPLPPAGTPERDEARKKRADAPYLAVSLLAGGEAPELLIHYRELDRVFHYEDLLLMRIGLLQDQGELDLSNGLLFNLKRSTPNWPKLADYMNRQLLAEARREFQVRKRFEWSLYLLEQIHKETANFPGLKKLLGEVIDKLASDSYAANDFRRTRHFVGRLQKADPSHAIYLKWRDRLTKEANGYLAAARTATSQKKHDLAAIAVTNAVKYWPRAPGLSGAFDGMTRRFQTLNVGVVNFSGDNPAYFLPTLADERQKYLTQTSLFEPKGYTEDPTPGDIIHYETDYFAEWEPNDLGRRTVFTLNARREYFRPQPEVTASDIAATLRGRLDPKSQQFDERLAMYVKSFSVLSPTQLQIQFSRVPARLESILNFPLIRSQPAAKGRAPGGRVDSPRFTPHNPSTWTADQRVFRRFIPEPDNVPENRYHVAQVIERKFPSHAEAIRALKRGKIQMLAHVRPWEVDILKQDTRFDVRRYAFPITHLIQFNPESDTLKSRELRRSLTYSLNREYLLYKIALKEEVKLGIEAKGRVVSGPFAQDSYASKSIEELKPLKHDLVLSMALKVVVERAHEKAFFTGMGAVTGLVWPEIDASIFADDKQEKAFFNSVGVNAAAASTGFGEKPTWLPTLRLLIPPDETVRKIAQQCVATWSRVGINVEIVTRGANGGTPKWDMVYRTIKMVDPVVDLWPFLTFEDRARVASLTHLPDWLRQELIQLDLARDWSQVQDLMQKLHEHLALQAQLLPLFEVDDYLAIRTTISAFRDPRLRPVYPYQNIERWIVNPWYPPNTP